MSATLCIYQINDLIATQTSCKLSDYNQHYTCSPATDLTAIAYNIQCKTMSNEQVKIVKSLSKRRRLLLNTYLKLSVFTFHNADHVEKRSCLLTGLYRIETA